jgi:hypothetical protein
MVHSMFSLADLRAVPPLAELAHCTDEELATLEVVAAAGCRRAGGQYHSLSLNGAGRTLS